jgi:hypothetical protein
MEIEIYINNEEIKYEGFKIELNRDKLINSIQIYTNNKYNINDEVFIVIDNLNPYLSLKITSIVNTITNNRSDYLIIASSKEYELLHYYTTETIQFDIGTSINNVINKYKFYNCGEDFNLLYTNELTVSIGINLGELISKILYEHGYILVECNKYNLNIQSIKNTQNTNIIEFIDSIKIIENKVYDSIVLYADNNIKYNEKWTYFNISSSGNSNLVYKPLINTNNFSLTKILDNLNYYNKMKSKIIELELFTDKYDFKLNNLLNLSKITTLEIDDSFTISKIEIDETRKIKIKGYLHA